MVKVAVARRNSEHCQDGLFSCDPTLLTPAEAKAVRTTYERRNQAACKRWTRKLPTPRAATIGPERNPRWLSKPECGGLQEGTPVVRSFFAYGA